MNYPVQLGGSTGPYNSVSHPAQSLPHHRRHQLSLIPYRHETKISIWEILFDDEVGLQSLRPMVADPVFHTPPASGQTAEASTRPLSRSDPAGKCKSPN